MRVKMIKAVKIIGLLALVGFMINSLLMLAQLKTLDSKLSENEKLLSKAVEYEESMAEKGEVLTEMAVVFEDISHKMETANATACSIADDAEGIRSMNNQLLSVNMAIDGVIVENIIMARDIAARMSQVVGTMGDVGSLLAGICEAAEGQLTKIGEMYRLAQENNASVPPLP